MTNPSDYFAQAFRAGITIVSAVLHQRSGKVVVEPLTAVEAHGDRVRARGRNGRAVSYPVSSIYCAEILGGSAMLWNGTSAANVSGVVVLA